MSEEAKDSDNTNEESKSVDDVLYDKKEAKPEASDEKAESKEADAGSESKEEESKEEESKEEEKPTVPDKYELKLPEDSLMGDADVERIASIAKEQGLSNEQAQAILKNQSDAISQFQEAQFDALEERKADWKKQVENDKELGGDKMKESVELAKRVARRFGSEDLIEKLNETGFGNHPEMVRMFYKIGKLMSDDDFIHPGGKTSSSEKSMEEVFYGGTTSAN